jgi:hypothetical protein
LEEDPVRVACLSVALAALLMLALGPGGAAAATCGQRITTNATLLNDLTNCPGPGLVIGADNITLDLNGHTIDGQGNGTGVSANGRRDVEVMRGAIQGFAQGVSFESVTQGAVRKVALGGNAVDCTSSAGCTIEGNTVYGAGIFVVKTAAGVPSVVRKNVVRGAPGAGITVNFTAGETTVERNLVEGNGSGIEALHSSVGRLGDNTIRWNTGNGIKGSSGGDTEIERNLIWRNGADGISIDHFVDARVFSNYIARNRRNGIRGQALARPLVEDNAVFRNEANGILLTGVTPTQEPTSFAVLTGNVAMRNALDGIALSTVTHDSQLDGNRLLRNGDDGIDVASPRTTLAGNLARRNADHGIEAPAGVRDAGGNRARRNGGSLQCVDVRCR